VANDIRFHFDLSRPSAPYIFFIFPKIIEATCLHKIAIELATNFMKA
jgi:hypothetical protein